MPEHTPEEIEKKIKAGRGAIQSSTHVMIPMPAKKTNMPRRGKRKPTKG